MENNLINELKEMAAVATDPMEVESLMIEAAEAAFDPQTYTIYSEEDAQEGRIAITAAKANVTPFDADLPF